MIQAKKWVLRNERDQCLKNIGVSYAFLRIALGLNPRWHSMQVCFRLRVEIGKIARVTEQTMIKPISGPIQSLPASGSPSGCSPCPHRSFAIGASRELMPMYAIRDERYSVYWQLRTCRNRAKQAAKD